MQAVTEQGMGICFAAAFDCKERFPLHVFARSSRVPSQLEKESLWEKGPWIKGLWEKESVDEKSME